MQVRRLNKTKVIITSIIIVLLIVYLVITINYLSRSSKNSIQTVHDATSVEELLDFYECKDVRIKGSNDNAFAKYIYLTFGKDLWDEDVSNEGYFGGIVANLAKILDYDNYRLIDSIRELTIDVLCDKESKETKAIYVNGELNYFQKEYSKKIAEKEYKPVDTTSFTIYSKELNELIDANWETKNIDFGTLESRFNNYDIYFDEGIEVKTIGGKVYNIIFTDKYKASIINGLNANSNEEDIVKLLGKPQFEFNGVYGYKGDKIYAFFSDNEVSVYRIENDYKQEEFLKAWQEFNETKNAKKFTSQITDIWQDFDNYIADSNYIEIQYTIKGVKIAFNVGGENGLLLYNNFRGMLQEELNLEKITKENLPQNVYLHTDTDLIFEQEKERIFKRDNLYNDSYIAMMEYDINIDGESLNDEELKDKYKFTDIKSNEFNLIFSYAVQDEISGIQFVSKNRNYPNSELIRHKKIYRYGWINDEQFIYSVKEQGIYLYNPKRREVKTLIEGNEDFYIKGIEDGKLLYDDKKLNLI